MQPSEGASSLPPANLLAKQAARAVRRCGRVAIVGRHNVGKSTLLNRVLRQKMSITSRKPQTTRRNLLGIDTEGVRQAVYVDTPGLLGGGARALSRALAGSALAALADVDLVVMVADRDKHTDGDALVLREVERAGKPAFALLNKVDLLDAKHRLLPAMQRLGACGLFAEILPVSALRGENVEKFRSLVFGRLPIGEHLFPSDQLTDQSERFLSGEIVREKLVRRLGDELPHRTAVRIEAFKEAAAQVDIHAQILVERPGQKGIIIGKGGQMLKAIGQQARQDIERLLGARVRLHLWVKVRPRWSDSPAAVAELGYAPGR